MPHAKEPARTLLEVCVDGVESAVAAAAGGADRIELCATLSVGGVTPSAGLIQACRAAVDLPIQVMIRPRSGDFVYSTRELAVIHHDIEVARSLGADGVVFGVLCADGTIDEARTQELVHTAGAMTTTFHRAFDMVRDQDAAQATLTGLGVTRILTSGGASRAEEAREILRRLVVREKPCIVPAAGIHAANIRSLVDATGAREVHVGSACRRLVPSQMQVFNDAVHMGSGKQDEYATARTKEELVRAIVDALS